MIKLERIVCPTNLSEDSERTIRYAVAITRASGAKLFVCYRPKTPADQEWAIATIHNLVTAGLTFPSGASPDGRAWRRFWYTHLIRFKCRQSAATGTLSFAGRSSDSRNSKHEYLCVN